MPTQMQFRGTNMKIVQGEPNLPDFDITLEIDTDADLLNDPCLGGKDC